MACNLDIIYKIVRVIVIIIKCHHYLNIEVLLSLYIDIKIHK